jgi:excisionase family DNA binding protein
MPSALSLYNEEIPSDQDAEMARELSRTFSGLGAENVHINVADSHQDMILPPSVIKLFQRILTAMAEKKAIAVIPIDAELTTQQAADIIGVSRPFLVGLLEKGEIEYRKVGTHRRISYEELKRYKVDVDEKRRQSLDALAALGQDLDENY